ncbi:MAG: DUF4386 domain-containing protein [Anaerolineae bacterium]|nr:DUF4386 domain-containing protein [Anaerolineae bacterium]
MTIVNRDASLTNVLTNQVHRDTTDPGWRWLYRLGAAAALVAAVGFRRNMGAEISLLSAQMPPSTANDWFTLLQDNSLLGLALLGLCDIVNYALVGLIILALCAALEHVNKSWTSVARTIGLMGIAVYFASNQAFSLLSLSSQYAAAGTDAQRSILLSAGEALLAIHNPGRVYQGTGIYIGLFLVTMAELMISVVMLRSGLFSRTTAYLGILGHTLVLGYFITVAVAPNLTFVPHTAAAIPILIWNLLIARRLFQLAR